MFSNFDLQSNLDYKTKYYKYKKKYLDLKKLTGGDPDRIISVTTTNNEETEKIKNDFVKKENRDLDELKDYVALRDIFRRYDVFDNSNSLMAGVFPPAWLAYNRKWWVLMLFILMSFMLISINIFMFLLGWVLTSVYCYQAQLNLLFSFSMLEGKVFSLKFSAKSIDEAHKIVRSLDPKSKFLFSKLEEPKNEDENENKK